MNEYQDRLDALYKLEFFGMKLGLENIRALLEMLGHPERRFDSIHIAGTNGKGSVAAMLAAVHQVAGKRTALYTSPHLVDFRERIRIDGEMISEEEVVTFLKKIWPAIEELKATFFEVTTAMTFDHFARHNIEIAIIETGLGGRLDATNVLDLPLATVITSIGHDHHAQLGPTLEDIAKEKAGIFKKGVPAIVNCQHDLEPIFIQCAKEIGSPLTFVRDAQKDLSDAALWEPPFPGAHQRENLLTVRATLRVLPIQIPDEIAAKAIRDTPYLTGLRGRLDEVEWQELRARNLRLFLDVGHNSEALQAVRQFFEAMNVRPIVIFGIMQDKEIDMVLKTIKSFASVFVAVAADTPRALSSNELASRAESIGLRAIDGGSVSNGVQRAIQKASKGKVLLLAGSHYVVGEFLRELSTGESGFRYLTSAKGIKNIA
jgi:dihydrofolate synthase / folylpolyglutamate synthase